jgi:uncharacterized protein YjbI with pentapeptide repeats
MHLVVLDIDAGSCFIVDSSVVGYDGPQNVRDEERPVGRKEPNRRQDEETKQSRWGFRGMTVRNWLELLIVPLVLVAIGLLFENQQAARQQAMEEQQQALAEQRAQDEALQAYLSQMSTLLLEKDLRESKEDSEVRILARARTLTVLKTLDSEHNSDILQFLREAQLIRGTDPVISLNRSNLFDATLSGVDLSGVEMRYANMRRADLSYADLSDANMSCADLSFADLSQASMRGANLSGAFMANADLSPASLDNVNLSNAYMRAADLFAADLSDADLSAADLSDADLRYADLRHAKLSDAILRGADLSDARGVTDAQVEQAKLDKTLPCGFRP